MFQDIPDVHRQVTTVWKAFYFTWQHVLRRPLRSVVLCNTVLDVYVPAPQMSTVLPRVTPALRQAWIPTESGSIRAPSSNVTLSGSLWNTRLTGDEKEKRKDVGGGLVNSLVTEVGTVCVVSAQVSIIRRRGAEEDGRRQVVTAVFEKLIHLSGNAWLNRHPVAWRIKRRLWHRVHEPRSLMSAAWRPLTYTKVSDRWANLQHAPRRLMSQHHRLLHHKVPNATVLPVMHVWATDSNGVHLE